jgi:hypothetical protein
LIAAMPKAEPGFGQRVGISAHHFAKAAEMREERLAAGFTSPTAPDTIMIGGGKRHTRRAAFHIPPSLLCPLRHYHQVERGALIRTICSLQDR